MTEESDYPGLEHQLPWCVVVDPAGYHRPWNSPVMPADWHTIGEETTHRKAREEADKLNLVKEIMKS